MIINTEDKFASFKEVEEAMLKLENESSVTFWRRDCRRIKSARVSQTIKPELVYSEITYCFIHGGEITHRNLLVKDQIAIGCDGCLLVLWYHYRCAGFKKSPKCLTWFCRACHESA